MAEHDEYEHNVLYEDGKFRVTAARGEDSHNLWIGKCEREKRDYFYIPRGVLSEIARTGDEEHARISLENMTQGILNLSLANHGAGISELRIAFARAKIKELEDALYYEHTKDIS